MATAMTPRAGADQSKPVRKWLIAGSVMFGTVLSVMDVTVVNVAMPHMMGSFGQDLLTIAWVSTAYSIAEMIMITMTAWWSTLVGRKQLFLGSMVLFTVGSVMAGTAQTFSQMLVWRVVQGAGGGSLIPVSQAVLRETFPPEEQGMAMAIYSMGVMLAPAAGPVVGGWLVDAYGWRWIFYMNVPFCLAGILMVLAFVHDPPYLKRGLARIDWGGIVLLAVWIIAMQIVLERGQEVDWFASRWILLGAIATVGAGMGLVVHELSSSEPVIDLRLFRNRNLAVGSVLGSLLGFVLYGSSFVLPQLTQDLLGYDAYHAGVVLLPRALVMFAMMPMIGRIYNYVNLRLLTLVGFILIGLAQWELAHLSLQVAFWSFLAPLVFLGMGIAATMVPLSTVSLSTVSRANMTGASGLYTLTRRVAGNLAYAILATIIDRRGQYHRFQLVQNVSQMNPTYLQAQQGFRSRLVQFGVSLPAASHRAVAMVNQILNGQAQIMAYNDANWACVVLVLAVVALVLLLPRRAPLAETGGAH
jgi:MFS transporter, DHA2 family, multidrug resistance protein